MQQTTFTDDYMSYLQQEQSFSPSSCDAESMQTQMCHSATTVSTFFDEICGADTCVSTTDISHINTPVGIAMVEGDRTEQELNFQGNTLPVTPTMVLSVPDQALQQQLKSVRVVEEVRIVTEQTLHEVVANVNQQESSSIDQSILNPEQRTSSLRRRKQGWIKVSIKLEEEPTKQSEENWNIPTESTTFLYYGTTIAVNTNQLYENIILGEGNFGVVYDVTLEGTPKVHMAVKRTAYRTARDGRSSANAELTIMKQVCTGNCPYVIHYYCALLQPLQSQLCICMEWMDTKMTLFYQAMHLMGGLSLPKSEAFVLRAVHSIVSALAFLQSEGIVHRDVKPDNMLLNNNAEIKLCDFGISTPLTQTELDSNAVTADAKYLQPFPSEHAFHADMWAFGISLLEIITGKYPLADLNPDSRHFEILYWDPVVPATDPDYIRQLVLHLLKKEATERPRSYDSILNEPVFQSVNKVPSTDELDFVRCVLTEIYPIDSVSN